LTNVAPPQPGQTIHVWIPPGTSERHRSWLTPGVEIHELPPADSPARSRLGPAQFVVADFNRKGFLELLGRLDAVRVVQALSAGIEDLAGRMPEGVVLCDGAGIHDTPVADWVVMAILAMYRGLPQHVISQQQARWIRPGAEGVTDLEGCTALIVGYGSIGRAVEARLLPFGVTVQRVGRRAREGVSAAAELPRLLPGADVVVILLPLTAQTERFVDDAFLSSMRQGAVLVNPSRGRVVDTAALMRALEKHQVRAALDVTDPEPLPDGHPLWKMDGVLITPHIAGSVEGAYDRAWRLVAEQLRRYLSGDPLKNVVTEGY
jgi:phosphoglycerate dehydrogenase-like enzyme